MSAVRVNWNFDYMIDPKYEHQLSIVNCVGTKYDGAVNSDLSFENFMETDKGGSKGQANRGNGIKGRWTREGNKGEADKEEGMEGRRIRERG